MSFQISIRNDSVTPDLQRLTQMTRDPTALMRAIGVSVVSVGKRAFNDEALRPNAWVPKADGSAATLKDTSTLWRSVRVVSADGRRVMVGSDRKYAAIHQLGGGKKRPSFPRRAYLPFTVNGKLTAPGVKAVQGAVNSWWRARGK